MDTAQRVETALEAALASAGAGAPQQLAHAMRYAVFPGGARVRPQLCLAVARACGDAEPALADASAAAIELLHCASLIHDDLPCFDAAATRRGKPSVHAAFGEPIAVLTGDGLIVLAFERLADAACSDRSRTSAAMLAIARGVGAPGGIVAGQAWESEAEVLIDQYHAAKTGALFVAATTAGAVAGGGDARAWRPLGEALGAAYQAADDLLDAVAVSSECDKPVGRDAALGRPSLVAEIGAEAAAARLRKLVDAAVAAVPSCPGENDLRDLVRATAMRLSPKKSARRAA